MPDGNDNGARMMMTMICVWVLIIHFYSFFAINVWTCFFFIPLRQIVKILEDESKPVPGEELLPALTTADRLAFLIIIIIMIIHYLIILSPYEAFSGNETNSSDGTLLTLLRIPTGRRQTSGLFYKHCWGFKLRTTEEQIQPLVVAGLKLRISSTLTAPLHCTL